MLYDVKSLLMLLQSKFSVKSGFSSIQFSKDPGAGALVIEFTSQDGRCELELYEDSPVGVSPEYESSQRTLGSKGGKISSLFMNGVSTADSAPNSSDAAIEPLTEWLMLPRLAKGDVTLNSGLEASKMSEPGVLFSGVGGVLKFCPFLPVLPLFLERTYAQPWAFSICCLQLLSRLLSYGQGRYWHLNIEGDAECLSFT